MSVVVPRGGGYLDETIDLRRIAVFDCVRNEVDEDELDARDIRDKPYGRNVAPHCDAAPRRHLVELASGIVDEPREVCLF